jgi:hypothetical protein
MTNTNPISPASLIKLDCPSELTNNYNILAAAVNNTLGAGAHGMYFAGNTDASVRAAALAAYNAGGGVVKLPAGTIWINSPLPAYPSVSYDGVPPQMSFGNNYVLPDSSYSLIGGTILAAKTPQAYACFQYNTTPISGASSTFGTQNTLTGISITNVGIDNFLYGIWFGAKNNTGLWYGKIENVYITRCFWGLYAKNFFHYYFNLIKTITCCNGMYFGIDWYNSNSTWAPGGLAAGNSSWGEIMHCTLSGGSGSAGGWTALQIQQSVGIQIEAGVNSIIGGGPISRIQNNSHRSLLGSDVLTVSATTNAGVTSTLPAGTYTPGMILQTGAVTGINNTYVGQFLFVYAVNGQTLWLGNVHPFTQYNSNPSLSGGVQGQLPTTAWATGTVYTAGQQIVASNGYFYECIQGGTSGASSPTGTGGVFADGTVYWQYLPNPIGYPGNVNASAWNNTGTITVNSYGMPALSINGNGGNTNVAVMTITSFDVENNSPVVFDHLSTGLINTSGAGAASPYAGQFGSGSGTTGTNTSTCIIRYCNPDVTFMTSVNSCIDIDNASNACSFTGAIGAYQTGGQNYYYNPLGVYAVQQQQWTGHFGVSLNISGNAKADLVPRNPNSGFYYCLGLNSGVCYPYRTITASFTMNGSQMVDTMIAGTTASQTITLPVLNITAADAWNQNGGIKFRIYNNSTQTWAIASQSSQATRLGLTTFPFNLAAGSFVDLHGIDNGSGTPVWTGILSVVTAGSIAATAL